MTRPMAWKRSLASCSGWHACGPGAGNNSDHAQRRAEGVSHVGRARRRGRSCSTSAGAREAALRARERETAHEAPGRRRGGTDADAEAEPTLSCAPAPSPALHADRGIAVVLTRRAAPAEACKARGPPIAFQPARSLISLVPQTAHHYH